MAPEVGQKQSSYRQRAPKARHNRSHSPCYSYKAPHRTNRSSRSTRGRRRHSRRTGRTRTRRIRQRQEQQGSSCNSRCQWARLQPFKQLEARSVAALACRRMSKWAPVRRSPMREAAPRPSTAVKSVKRRIKAPASLGTPGQATLHSTPSCNPNSYCAGPRLLDGNDREPLLRQLSPNHHQ